MSAKDFLKPETLPDSFSLGTYSGDWHTRGTQCLLEETANDAYPTCKEVPVSVLI